MWDIGKQCRPRSDAAERGAWSGSPLFAHRMFYKKLNKNEMYHSAPVQQIETGKFIRIKWVIVFVSFFVCVLIPLPQGAMGQPVIFDSGIAWLYPIVLLSFWNHINGMFLASCFFLKAALDPVKINTENVTILDIISANVQYKHLLSPVSVVITISTFDFKKVFLSNFIIIIDS